MKTNRLFHRALKMTVIGLCVFGLAACSTTKKHKDIHQGKSAETIYQSAQKNMRKKRFDLAIKDLEALEAKYPYGEYADKSQLSIIYAFYKRDEKAQALAAANRFIRIHPRHPEVDYAHYMKGLVNYEDYFSFIFRHFPVDKSLRDPTPARESFDDFKLLIQKFPNSKYVHDARLRMLHLREYLARHEIHIAQHYLKHKAYVAAAGRANMVLNQYNGTSQVSEALVILVKSYRGLGIRDLEQTSLDLLAKHDPAAYKKVAES